MKKTFPLLLLLLLSPATLPARTPAIINDIYKVSEINSWDNRVREVWYTLSTDEKGKVVVNRSETTSFPHVDDVIHHAKNLPFDIYQVKDKHSIFIAPHGTVKRQYILTIENNGRLRDFVVKAGVYQVVKVGDYVRPVSRANEHREFWSDLFSGLVGRPYFWYLD